MFGNLNIPFVDVFIDDFLMVRVDLKSMKTSQWIWSKFLSQYFGKHGPGGLIFLILSHNITSSAITAVVNFLFSAKLKELYCDIFCITVYMSHVCNVRLLFYYCSYLNLNSVNNKIYIFIYFLTLIYYCTTFNSYINQ